MIISLEQNSSSDSATVPFYANIDIATVTIDFDTSFSIPIKQYENGATKYSADVCGFHVDADSPDALLGLIDKILTGLINMSRLPTYVFIARRSHRMYPVYTYNDKVFATTPDGPLFEHVELAKVREYLSEYLHNTGDLGTPGKSEKLHVRGIHRKTLGLVRPIFYLKKRALSKGEYEFWAPVFPSQDGHSIYAYAANGRREVDVADGYEVFWLRSQVAQALIADKRLKENMDLRPDRLLPEYWERVKNGLELLPSKLTFNGSSFDVYRKGRSIVAVEYRSTEDRYSFYIGKDIDDLCERTGKDLVRRGMVSSADAVKVVG